MKLDISKLHLEILDDSRKKLLSEIIPFTQEFILGGGTALGLQIAHRESFDFDFFSEQEIPKDLSEKISRSIEFKEILVQSGDELTFLTRDNVKVSFRYYYFKPYYDSIEVSNGLNLFSIQEIAVKKAYTIGRRGVYRDYFDLYSILNGDYSNLQEIISAAENIYEGLFSSKLFLEQLVYFKDIPDFDIEPVGDSPIPTRDEVCHYLEEIVSEYL